jgi:phosphonate transport system substrate-binding protein
LLKSLFSAFTILIITLGLSGCSPRSENAETPTKIAFAGISFASDADTYDTYKLLIELLERELEIEVEYYETSQTPAVIEGLVSGNVQLAQLNQTGYVLATSKIPNLELVGVTAANATAPLFAKGYGIKRADTPAINSLADLRGKKVCFSDPTSTIGYMVPARGLLEAGIDANPVSSKDIQVVFAGGFMEVGFGVQRGDCEVGFMNDLTYTTLIPNTGKIKDGELETFWTSGDVPNPPLVISGDLPVELKSKIKKIVLEQANKTWLTENGFCKSEQECNLIATSRWGWRAEVDSSFEGLRETCAILEFKECS